MLLFESSLEEPSLQNAMKKQADRLSRVSRWGATLFCKLQEKCRPNSQRENINRESIDGT
jgi:hypothetical protein